MPFTPFHFGVGMLAQGLVRRFSFGVFITTQVFIDVETAWNMVSHAPRLHTFFHTAPGSLVPAALAVLLHRPIFRVTAWALGIIPSVARWAEDEFRAGSRTLVFSALFAAQSHVFLDAIMHADALPLHPWLDHNPWLDAISVGWLHLACLGMGIVGTGLWLARGKSSASETGSDA